jgi:hypothetical protein
VCDGEAADQPREHCGNYQYADADCERLRRHLTPHSGGRRILFPRRSAKAVKLLLDVSTRLSTARAMTRPRPLTPNR